MNLNGNKRPRPFWQRVWEMDLAQRSPHRAVLVRSLRVVHMVTQEVSAGDLIIRAQGLVYTSLLSLVPLLAVSFSVLKGLGIHARYEIALYYFLEPLGDSGVELSMRLIGFVEKAQAAIVGTVGLAFLFFTVFSLVGRVEATLNHIWHEEKKKHCLPRFATYVSVILAAPLMLAFAVGFAASLKQIPAVQSLVQGSGLIAFLPIANKVLSFAMVTGVFTFLYTVVPNTNVRTVPALTGGIFAAASWLLTGWVFARFVATSARYSAIYSSFAVIILLLIWLYWSFLILMLGARVAFYTQYPGLHRTEHGNALGSSTAEACALRVLYIICRNFHEGAPAMDIRTLVRRLHMPVEQVKDVLGRLESRGLIARVDDSRRDTWLPARDMDSISIGETLDAVRSSERTKTCSVTAGDAVQGLLSEFEELRHGFFGRRTVGQLVRAETERQVKTGAVPEK